MLLGLGGGGGAKERVGTANIHSVPYLISRGFKKTAAVDLLPKDASS